MSAFCHANVIRCISVLRSGFAYVALLFSPLNVAVLVKMYEEMSYFWAAKSWCYRSTVLTSYPLCKEESPAAMGLQESVKNER